MPIRKSSISGTPHGNTASRPSSPSVGQTYYNGELGYQEIYTSSGTWTPTGSGSFTILTSSGGIKTATLSNPFPAGTYMIESKGGDTNLVVYLASSAGALVGVSTAGSKTVTASDSFIYVTTENADTDDAVTFTYKPTSTLQTKTDAVWSKPTITSLSTSSLPNINNTVVISGTNFASNVTVQFRKSNNTDLLNAKSVVRTSATSLTVTRPDIISPADAPFDLIVTNPDTGYSVTSTDSITVGSSPVWVTAADALGTFATNTAVSTSIQATDSDGGSSVTYSVVSGSLPTGLSLNSNTGAITGTTGSSSESANFTVRATDSGSNYADRTFSMGITAFVTTGGNITSLGSERVHVFYANGTFTIPQTLNNVKVLLVAGGGSNGNGGGGGGGLLYHSGKTLSAGSYAVTIGSGGSGANGNNSVFSDMTAIGGGLGCAGTGGCNGSAGGSGGGGGRDSGAGGAALQGNSGGATGYGNPGGSSANTGWGGAGGGGGAGSAGSPGQGGSPGGEYGGAGGNGRQYDITGTSTYYAAGHNGSWGAGGTNGGQAGLGGATNAAGPANSGSGGGPGGSGICVIRFTVPA